MSAANPARGESALSVAGETLTIRPTFQALVAAESELGPLFTLVERAVEGRLTLTETVALIWHCVHDRPDRLTREALGEAIAEVGLTKLSPVLRRLLGQILSGR